MDERLVTFEREGDIALVGIDRTVKRNAISDAVMTQLEQAIVRATEEVRCGILFGHGGNFSAGLDLAEAVQRMRQSDGGAQFKRRGRWTRPLELVARGPIPWIAALNGACIGGGLEIASACQIRVADETTFFALPEGKRGIFVGGGGSVRIQRLIGYARMADMMLTGRVLSAGEGERANLCQYVVPVGEALAKARQLAAQVADNAETTNWAICAALPRINDMGHEDGLFFESLIGGGARNAERDERLRAFVERGENKVARPAIQIAGDD
ncbi:MAG TPA: crotonase/enoyl-CoA hydratase family protein [Sphingomonadaceae bacterium]|nr:crotonase/enoyl-CoA hydratase family protein [Sphingomonadaceae bacterium]